MRCCAHSWGRGGAGASSAPAVRPGRLGSSQAAARVRSAGACGGAVGGQARGPGVGARVLRLLAGALGGARVLGALPRPGAAGLVARGVGLAPFVLVGGLGEGAHAISTSGRAFLTCVIIPLVMAVIYVAFLRIMKHDE